ncbi:hypothetical protein C8J56DRAFT_1104093 [Mycena floridula]|nr:hypothetical protein C8J56DRAFT_1104093 [Mycena floridula]
MSQFQDPPRARETSPSAAAEQLLAEVRNFLESPNPERVLKVPCTVAQLKRIELVDDTLRIEFAPHESVAAYLSKRLEISDRTPSTPTDPLNPNATVILETAYTETLEHVRKKAARYLLQDGFGARLVIIVKFQSKDGSPPTSNDIESIVWENWRIFEIEDAVKGSKDTGLVACEVNPIEGTLAYSSIIGSKSVKAGKIEDYTIYPLSESPPHEIPIYMGDVCRRCPNPEEVVTSVVIREFSAYVMNALKESTDTRQFNSLKRSAKNNWKDDSIIEWARHAKRYRKPRVGN